MQFYRFRLFSASQALKTLNITTSYLNELNEQQLREAFELQPKLLKELLSKYLKQKTPANLAKLDEIIDKIITENQQYVEEFIEHKDETIDFITLNSQAYQA